MTKEDLINSYKEAYENAYTEKLDYHKKSGKKNAINSARMEAQSEAVRKVYDEGFKNGFSVEDIRLAIKDAFVEKYVQQMGYIWGEKDVIDAKLAKVFESAYQAHKSCSGKIFEDIIEMDLSEKLSSYNIVIVKPATLSKWLKDGKIENGRTDRTFLLDQIKKKNFDLYGLVKTSSGNYTVFEVIETKTSTKDREDRIRNFTKDAMNKHNFFSICIILSGESMTSKNIDSINGKGTYHNPSCNAAYTMDGKNCEGRIYNYDIITKHTKDALDKYVGDSKGLNSDWNPEKSS